MNEVNIESIREYCLLKPEVTESFPFDETTLVFKVANKMFALLGLEKQPLGVNLKCDPLKAIELREHFDYVRPGYHMSKKHWNTIYIEQGVSVEQIKEWIDDSYLLIVNALPKATKEPILAQL